MEWSNKFSVDNEIVDGQHRYFVTSINRIKEELNKTENLEYQKRLLLELVKYAEFHFISEENVAMSLNLPHLEQHKQYHQDIHEQLEERVNLFMQNKLGANDIILFLWDWFMGHTYNEDRVLFGLKEPNGKRNNHNE